MTRRRFKPLASPTFIDINRLMPGDVILSRSREKDSKAIAVATSGPLKAKTTGPFSHAQLVMHDGLVIESTYNDDYSGVQMMTYPFIRLRREGRETLFVCEISNECEYFEVFRYSARDFVEVKKLEEFRVELADGAKLGLLGEPYSSPKGLSFVTMLAGSYVGRWLAERIAAAHVPEPPWEGLYCSQLVLLLYKEAGLHLFEGLGDTLPDVTPNGLAQCDRLENVTEGIRVKLTDREIVRLRKSYQALMISKVSPLVRKTEVLHWGSLQDDKVFSRIDWLKDVSAAKELIAEMSRLVDQKQALSGPARVSLKVALGRALENWLDQVKEARPGTAMVAAMKEAEAVLNKEFSGY